MYYTPPIAHIFVVQLQVLFYQADTTNQNKQALSVSRAAATPSNISMALVSRSLTELLACLKILRLVSF